MIERSRLTAHLASLGAEIEAAHPVRDSAESEGASDDSAAIVRLANGSFAFVHEQPATNGIGTVIGSLPACEDAARNATYRGQPSDVAARLGITPRVPGGRGVR